MNFLLSYTIIMNREDVDKSDDERRRKKNRWITDAVFAPNRQMFIITNSTRSITIYDASNLHHIPLWLIIGCPSILTSLCFLDKKVKPILYSGNEYGEIITFEFHQKDDLFRKKHSDKMSLFYWGELKNEKESVTIKNLGKIHQGAINHLKYFENTECLLTCSKDSKKSGVNCCYLSNKLKQLITGSEDGKIHVFNIFVTKNPIQIIKLHKTGIIDLIILECNNYSISCSRDGYLILMDLKEFVPLQTLCIQFQAFNELGKIIEWGKNSLCPGPKRQQPKDNELNLNENYDVWERTNILITCCNNLVSLDLHFLDGKIRNFDSSVLPPPPLQNSVLIPVHWKISEEKREIKCEVSEWDENLSEHIKSLEFILNKDLIKPEDRNNINFKISQLEAKKNQMRRAVAEGAPYLALDLPNISELQLSPNLPIPDQKKIQRIVQKSYRLLSAASQRSIIFSSSSPSSSSRSKSRSSIIEFD
nr:uncharacterized protein LOC111419835 [Onthophagus taurus]